MGAHLLVGAGFLDRAGLEGLGLDAADGFLGGDHEVGVARREAQIEGATRRPPASASSATGVNATKEAILEKVAALGPDVVGLSALLTTSMPAKAKTVAALKEAAHAIPIIVGGAPVTQVFARTIGADGYGENAPAAVLKVGELVGARGNAEPAGARAYCAA